MRWLVLCLLLVPPAEAEVLVASRRLPAQTILTREDLQGGKGDQAAAFRNPSDLIGMETRVTHYPGQVILRENVGAAALIDRNALVRIEYRFGTLVIEAEGRALGRAALGETVRVMNLASKATISGRVAADGHVILGEPR